MIGKHNTSSDGARLHTDTIKVSRIPFFKTFGRKRSVDLQNALEEATKVCSMCGKPATRRIFKNRIWFGRCERHRNEP